MSDTLLKIDNLSVDYETARGDLKALRDITFDVNRGEIVGIVGESGCGKSTLISSILRLTAPNTRFREGEVRFKGRDLLTLPEREMRALRGADMSIVFQDPMQTIIRCFRLAGRWWIFSIAHPHPRQKNAPVLPKCWALWGSPIPRHGWTNSRMSFPVGCASGLPLPWH
ncbi:Oligopeptide transport ATP-binding protein OppD [Aliiroseovarius sp. xm-d-517]|nr:Oligopeptide transport ATP-binding protein OppD [Aliiroseovarius sp. xm-d-517]NRP41468.1 Oligopeptide transport ATP-binding protein OppD [Aliiroseovarius sp. xm-m-339-2]NRP62474.1 Oligopeptide transport ATP-binding protein OppD [Aliiroseovarius sp. xm-a-151]